MACQSYLVRTRHHTILIDTCNGCHKSVQWVPEGWQRDNKIWLDNLAAAGVGPEDIDYVFCTHFHSGWNTRLVDGRWTPTFANAKYIFAREEYAQAETENPDIFGENVLPVMVVGHAVIVDMDYALDDNVWLEPTPGHTAGHVAVHLASKDKHALMCGDLMHSPIQLAHPGWSPGFDRDRTQSTATRKAFLDAHCESDTLVLTSHFPAPSVGRLVRHRERPFDFSYL